MRFSILDNEDKRIGTYRDTNETYTEETALKQVQLVISELQIGGIECVYEFTPTKYAIDKAKRNEEIIIKVVNIQQKGRLQWKLTL